MNEQKYFRLFVAYHGYSTGEYELEEVDMIAVGDRDLDGFINAFIDPKDAIRAIEKIKDEELKQHRTFYVYCAPLSTETIRKSSQYPIVTIIDGTLYRPVGKGEKLWEGGA